MNHFTGYNQKILRLNTVETQLQNPPSDLKESIFIIHLKVYKPGIEKITGGIFH